MKKLTFIALCLALGGGLAARAEVAATPALPEVDHMVYLSFLPESEELMADAKTNGLTVLRLDRTADRVVVTYKYPDGNVGTLGYALLGSARGTDRVKERVVEVERPVTVIEREPEIVYVDRTPRTRVVYRERDDFWLPLTLGVGLGWVIGDSGHHHHHRHHYYRGGYRGHYRGHHWRH